MSSADARAGSRAGWLAWVAKGCPIAPPELTVVPPCAFCGAVPTQYHRFNDGTVQCLNRGDCYKRMNAKEAAHNG